MEGEQALFSKRELRDSSFSVFASIVWIITRSVTLLTNRALPLCNALFTSAGTSADEICREIESKM